MDINRSSTSNPTMTSFDALQDSAIDWDTIPQTQTSVTQDLKSAASTTRLWKIGKALDITTQKAERRAKERAIKPGDTIPGTNNQSMAQNPNDAFKRYSAKLKCDQKAASRVCLTYSSLRHICTGDHRQALVHRHTGENYLEHWVSSILARTKRLGTTWACQDNIERKVIYLTAFSKSQLNGSWIGERLILTKSKSPTIITAYPITDHGKLRSELKNLPMLGHQGLEQLPKALIKNLEPFKATQIQVELPVAYEGNFEIAPEPLIITEEDTSDIELDQTISNAQILELKHGELTLLEWTKIIDDIELRVQFVENTCLYLADKLKAVKQQHLTNKQQTQDLYTLEMQSLNNIFRSISQDDYMLPLMARLSAEVLIFDVQLEEAEKLLQDKDKTKILKQELPSLNFQAQKDQWHQLLGKSLNKLQPSVLGLGKEATKTLEAIFSS